MHPWNIAHRGGAQLMPENTLPAFADAMACSYDGAELDVQLTADGVAVVHHDDRLMADVARENGIWLEQPGQRIGASAGMGCRRLMSERPGPAALTLWHMPCSSRCMRGCRGWKRSWTWPRVEVGVSCCLWN